MREPDIYESGESNKNISYALLLIRVLLII